MFNSIAEKTPFLSNKENFNNTYITNEGILGSDFSLNKYKKIINRFGELEFINSNWLKIKVSKGTAGVNKELNYLFYYPYLFISKNKTRTFLPFLKLGRVVWNGSEFLERATQIRDGAKIPNENELKAIAIVVCGNNKGIKNSNYEKLGLAEKYWSSTRGEDKNIFTAKIVSFRSGIIAPRSIGDKYNVTCVVRQ